MKEIRELLQGNPYPGRGIALGRSADGKRAMVVYFIMGRSVNSRNRIFETTEDGIRTKAFDESKMTDPSLIIYHPVREFRRGLIVTNGDQTDTIRDFLAAAAADGSACARYTFEYPGLAGVGHFISTYETDGDPLPAFTGEPRCLAFGSESAKELADQVWSALNEDNKVSLFVRTVELASGETDTVIINKHEEEKA